MWTCPTCGMPVRSDEHKLRHAKQWCPICKTYHSNPGQKTDAGTITRLCPLLRADDPRNYGAALASSRKESA
jgi:hypothetical protein